MRQAASLVFCLCALISALPGVQAASKEKEKERDKEVAMAPELSSEEAAAIHRLFDNLRAGFVAGDAGACLNLFVPGIATRPHIEENLRNEFRQSRYVKFEIVQIVPEDKLQPAVYSVDVRLRIEFINLNRPPEMQRAITNSTSETFVIKKFDDGTFALLSSEFFDNLGLRQGMGLVVEGLLALMIAIALLGFQIWMGVETLRARPRQRAWLAIVLIPVVGALLYFAISYLPRQLRTPRV